MISTRKKQEKILIDPTNPKLTQSQKKILVNMLQQLDGDFLFKGEYQDHEASIKLTHNIIRYERDKFSKNQVTEQYRYGIFPGKPFAQGGQAEIYHYLGTLSQPNSSLPELHYKEKPKTRIVKKTLEAYSQSMVEQNLKDTIYSSAVKEQEITSHMGSFATKKIAKTEDGLFSGLVAEYLGGCDLEKFLEKVTEGKETLSFKQRMNLALGILETVKEAHRNGVLHCDIKPSNFMINPIKNSDKFEVKLIDYGLAKYVHEDQCELLSISTDTLESIKNLKLYYHAAYIIVNEKTLFYGHKKWEHLEKVEITSKNLKILSKALRASETSRLLSEKELNYISSLTLNGHVHLTSDGLSQGSPYYVAPEINLGKRSTHASDVYSLGMTLRDIFQIDIFTTPIGWVNQALFEKDLLGKAHAHQLTDLFNKMANHTPWLRPSLKRVILTFKQLLAQRLDPYFERLQQEKNPYEGRLFSIRDERDEPIECDQRFELDLAGLEGRLNKSDKFKK